MEFWYPADGARTRRIETVIAPGALGGAGPCPRSESRQPLGARCRSLLAGDSPSCHREQPPEADNAPPVLWRVAPTTAPLRLSADRDFFPPATSRFATEAKAGCRAGRRPVARQQRRHASPERQRRFAPRAAAAIARQKLAGTRGSSSTAASIITGSRNAASSCM